MAAVEVAGWPDLNAAPLVAKLPQKVGMKYSAALVEQSVAALNSELRSGGRLQGVEVEVRPELTGIRVFFVLEPAQYFGIYSFPGALQFSYSRLLEAARFQIQEPYTRTAVIDGVAGLEQFFQQEGYFQARIEADAQPDAALGMVNVRYHVAMGPRARLGPLEFTGVTPKEARQLANRLGSWGARRRHNAVREGSRYSFTRLQNATQSVQGSLNRQGYLGAQARLGATQYARASNRATVEFEVDRGPLVHLAITGAHLWPWTRRALVPIYQESRVDPELIQEGQGNLANYFAVHGYFDAVVTTTVRSRTASGVPPTTQVTRRDANAITAPAPPAGLAISGVFNQNGSTGVNAKFKRVW